MSDVKRYRQSAGENNDTMVVDDIGAWVQHSDVQVLVAELFAQSARSIETSLRVLSLMAKYDCYDDVWWRTDGQYAPVTFMVNCNDVFMWGCADAEEITHENIHILEETYNELAPMGLPELAVAKELFCARVGKMRPQGAFYKFIPENMWHLFDDCGEEREVGLGNPYKPGEYGSDNG